MNLPARLDTRVQQGSGCWFWSGQRDRHGYGRLRGRMAHRLVYEAIRGPIPSGLDLDHLCRVRPCVNPAHVEPVTRSENSRRSNAPRRLQRFCKQGHEYTPENTIWRVGKNGQRNCRQCMNAAQRRYQERRRAA